MIAKMTCGKVGGNETATSNVGGMAASGVSVWPPGAALLKSALKGAGCTKSGCLRTSSSCVFQSAAVFMLRPRSPKLLPARARGQPASELGLLGSNL